MNPTLLGTHIATNQPVEIELNSEEVQYYHSGSNRDWDKLCDSILDRTGIEIPGQIDLEYIILNGQKRIFH